LESLKKALLDDLITSAAITGSLLIIFETSPAVESGLFKIPKIVMVERKV
jgi:hypothetical protein